jgi:hypothetical protein
VELVGATSFLGCCYECCLGSASLVVVVAEACLWPIRNLSADLRVLFFFLVVVTSTRIAVSVTVSGAGLGEGGFAALTTRPPRTTWFQPGPKLNFYSELGSLVGLAIG